MSSALECSLCWCQGNLLLCWVWLAWVLEWVTEVLGCSFRWEFEMGWFEILELIGVSQICNGGEVYGRTFWGELRSREIQIVVFRLFWVS